MTGKVISTKDVPNGAAGVPAVYEAKGREYILLPDRGPCFSRRCEDGARRCEPTGRFKELRRFRAATVTVVVVANDESHARVRRMTMKPLMSGESRRTQ